MRKTEIKGIMFEVFKKHNCYFRKSDILVTVVNHGYIIVIRDYEHIVFEVKCLKDDCFGCMVEIYEDWGDYRKCIVFIDNPTQFKTISAFEKLAEHIANTF